MKKTSGLLKEGNETGLCLYDKKHQVVSLPNIDWKMEGFFFLIEAAELGQMKTVSGSGWNYYRGEIVKQRLMTFSNILTLTLPFS